MIVEKHIHFWWFRTISNLLSSEGNPLPHVTSTPHKFSMSWLVRGHTCTCKSEILTTGAATDFNLLLLQTMRSPWKVRARHCLGLLNPDEPLGVWGASSKVWDCEDLYSIWGCPWWWSVCWPGKIELVFWRYFRATESTCWLESVLLPMRLWLVPCGFALPLIARLVSWNDFWASSICREDDVGFARSGFVCCLGWGCW